MILSGREIERHLGHEISIEPFVKSRLNPNSYNLTLADELMVYDNHELDMKKENTGHLIKIPKEGYLLKPNTLYLGRTHEYPYGLFCPHAGRSLIHWTSGTVYPCNGRIWRCGI